MVSPVAGTVGVDSVSICVLASVVVFLSGSHSRKEWRLGIDCLGGGDAWVEMPSLSEDSRCCLLKSSP